MLGFGLATLGLIHLLGNATIDFESDSTHHEQSPESTEAGAGLVSVHRIVLSLLASVLVRC
jgi:hypothetical protein